MSKNIKKNGNTAAMFGLDARIAIIIFAVISAITGFSIIKTYQKIKISTTIMELQEIGKAHEAYIIDTGILLPKSTSSTHMIESSNLLVDPGNVANWKGPYLSQYKSTTDAFGSWLYKRSSDDWKDRLISFVYTADNSPPFSACPAGSPCNFFVELDYPTTYCSNFMKLVDMQIDSSDSPLSGRFIYREDGSTSNCLAYLKYGALSGSFIN